MKCNFKRNDWKLFTNIVTIHCISRSPPTSTARATTQLALELTDDERAPWYRNYMYEHGRPPPKPMMHFPPISDFPLFSEYFTVWEHFSNFSQKNVCYLFLVIDSDFVIYPLFLEKQYLPPISTNVLFPPTFLNFPDFIKFTCVLI